MQNKKVKYKKKREFTEALGFYAVYMDHRKNHLFCKFELVAWNKYGVTRTSQQTIERVKKTAEEFGYEWGTTDFLGNPVYAYVRIPYDDVIKEGIVWNQ